jgi:hypothetical protein
MGVFPSRQLVSVAFSQNHKGKLVPVDWGARYSDSQLEALPPQKYAPGYLHYSVAELTNALAAAGGQFRLNAG